MMQAHHCKTLQAGFEDLPPYQSPMYSAWASMCDLKYEVKATLRACLMFQSMPNVIELS